MDEQTEDRWKDDEQMNRWQQEGKERRGGEVGEGIDRKKKKSTDEEHIEW